MAYGYGLYVTPLVLVTYYNALQNDGKMAKPFLVERVEEGTPIKPNDSVSLGQIMPKHVADTLLKELGYASCSTDFIGKSAIVQLPNSNQGDKDADRQSKYAASCVGFFPINEPRYTVICVLYSEAISRPFYIGTKVAEGVIKDYITLQQHD